MTPPIETFPTLELHANWIIHGLVRRAPDIDVLADRETALARLTHIHTQARNTLGLALHHLHTAEQVHGKRVARITDPHAPSPIPNCDALVTDRSDVALGIYVADCCPVYLLDPVARAIGLAHAGRRGSELGIVPETIAEMHAAFGCDPANLVVQLGPCIRPPLYEIDFAALIRQQCTDAGVRQVHDCFTCTASHPERYYSYRRELGRTGRMLALLAKRP